MGGKAVLTCAKKVEGDGFVYQAELFRRDEGQPLVVLFTKSPANKRCDESPVCPARIPEHVRTELLGYLKGANFQYPERTLAAKALFAETRGVSLDDRTSPYHSY